MRKDYCRNYERRCINLRLNGKKIWDNDLVDELEKGFEEFASNCKLTHLRSLAFDKAIEFEENNKLICFKNDL